MQKPSSFKVLMPGIKLLLPQGKLPAKWMAIEAIESGMYSSHSDV